MKCTTTTTGTGTAPIRRPGPLMYDCCRCGIGRTLFCLHCRRWVRFGEALAQRNQARGKN